MAQSTSSAVYNPVREKMFRSLFPKDLMDERKRSWEQFIENMENASKAIPDTDDGVTMSEYVNGLEATTSRYLKEIRDITFERNESRLLEDGHFEDWCQKLFNVILEVRSELHKDDVKSYIKAILKRNLPEIKNKIRYYKSNLGKKIILRKETGKAELKRHETLNFEIRKEWERLSKVMPMEDLVVYCLDVLKDHKLKQIQRRQTGVSIKNQRDKQFVEDVKGKCVLQAGTCSARKKRVSFDQTNIDKTATRSVSSQEKERIIQSNKKKANVINTDSKRELSDGDKQQITKTRKRQSVVDQNDIPENKSPKNIDRKKRTLRSNSNVKSDCKESVNLNDCDIKLRRNKDTQEKTKKGKSDDAKEEFPVNINTPMKKSVEKTNMSKKENDQLVKPNLCNKETQHFRSTMLKKRLNVGIKKK